MNPVQVLTLHCHFTDVCVLKLVSSFRGMALSVLKLMIKDSLLVALALLASAALGIAMLGHRSAHLVQNEITSIGFHEIWYRLNVSLRMNILITFLPGQN